MKRLHYLFQIVGDLSLVFSLVAYWLPLVNKADCFYGMILGVGLILISDQV